MATVDLVYSTDCPNVPMARANLLLAFARTGLQPKWTEHRIGDPEAPARTRGFGSPTILVNGRDVAGAPPSTENCCRVYEGSIGFAPAPSVEQIVAALTTCTT
jgi:mercuric ion transport protein